MKDYPVIGHRDKLSPKKGRCVICGEGRSDLGLHIEYNIFRGDDDVIKVHKDCFYSLPEKEKEALYK